MTWFCRLSRKHYWCIPHRSADNRLVQVCYECGAERPVRELHTEVWPDHINQSLVASPTNLAIFPTQHARDLASSPIIKENTQVIVQNRERRFTLVK